MDPMTVAAASIAAAQTALTITSAYFAYITKENFRYRQARFGIAGHIFAVLYLIDTRAIRELHWNINTWTNEEVLAWKASYMVSCTAIQVAGAIFASVGLTALQVPNMNLTHWSARALLICSMILGVLSVAFASSLQQEIGMLNNAIEIRLWMSRGKVELEKRTYGMPYKLLPLESSMSALKQFSLPKMLLNLAVLLYTIGFGIYLLYSWLYHVDSSGGNSDYRNIFIAFVITVGLVVIYQLYLSGSHFSNSWKRDREFDVDRSTGFAKPAPRKQLEEWLTALDGMQKMDIADQEDYAILETIVTDLKTKWERERKQKLESFGYRPVT